MARRTLTDIGVAALKPRTTRYNLADPQLPGHYVRVHPKRGKSFAVVTRNPAGKQTWHTIGATTLHKIDDARELARAFYLPGAVVAVAADMVAAVDTVAAAATAAEAAAVSVLGLVASAASAASAGGAVAGAAAAATP